MKGNFNSSFNLICSISILFILCCPTSSVAQETASRLKYGFELSYTPSYNLVKQSNKGNINNASFQTITSEENGRIVNPFALHFTYDPLSRLRLKLGVGFQQVGYNSPKYKSALENNEIQELQIKVSSRYVQVPLSLQFFVTKSIYIETSYVPLFLVNSKRTTLTVSENFSNESRYISQNGYRNYNQMIDFSVGYQARLGESSISLSIAPKVSYTPSFAEVSQAQIQRSHWQFGLTLGIHSFL